MTDKNNILGLMDKPLNYIDEGNFFRSPIKWLYMILAVLNVFAPFVILYQAIDMKIFSGPSKLIFAFILIWVVLLAGFFLLALLWWNRKEQVSKISVKDSAFPVTPVFAHFFRTIGEWFGLLVGVVMFVCGLIALIFMGSDASYLSRVIPMLGSGVRGVILMPVYGFLIIFITRFVSEQIKVLVAVADNTSKK